METFKGIIFTLKKRKQNPNQDDTPYYKYLTCGYFDGQDIRVVDSWNQMKPQGLDNNDISQQTANLFVDQYIIKALFPNINEEQGKSFCYSVFDELQENPEETLKNALPFITISLLSATKGLVEANPGLEKISGVMLDYLSQLEEKPDGLEYAIFLSLGYSDFVVVCLTDDLEKAALVIDRLRGMVLENGTAAFSSCYTVCGFNKYHNSLHKIRENDNVRISIRLNLKEGITTKQFCDDLGSFVEQKKDDQDNNNYDILIQNLRNHKKQIKVYTLYTICYNNNTAIQ